MWRRREGEWERERQARDRLMAEVGGQLFSVGTYKVTVLSGVG